MPVVRELTVASLREPEEADHVEVLFLESARFYRLPRAHAGFDEVLGLLRRALEEHRTVLVEQPSTDSDVIQGAQMT